MPRGRQARGPDGVSSAGPHDPADGSLMQAVNCCIHQQAVHSHVDVAQHICKVQTHKG